MKIAERKQRTDRWKNDTQEKELDLQWDVSTRGPSFPPTLAQSTCSLGSFQIPVPGTKAVVVHTVEVNGVTIVPIPSREDFERISEALPSLAKMQQIQKVAFVDVQPSNLVLRTINALDKQNVQVAYFDHHYDETLRRSDRDSLLSGIERASRGGYYCLSRADYGTCLDFVAPDELRKQGIQMVVIFPPDCDSILSTLQGCGVDFSEVAVEGEQSIRDAVAKIDSKSTAKLFQKEPPREPEVIGYLHAVKRLTSSIEISDFIQTIVEYGKFRSLNKMLKAVDPNTKDIYSPAHERLKEIKRLEFLRAEVLKEILPLVVSRSNEGIGLYYIDQTRLSSLGETGINTNIPIHVPGTDKTYLKTVAHDETINGESMREVRVRLAHELFRPGSTATTSTIDLKKALRELSREGVLADEGLLIIPELARDLRLNFVRIVSFGKDSNGEPEKGGYNLKRIAKSVLGPDAGSGLYDRHIYMKAGRTPRELQDTVRWVVNRLNATL